MNAAEAAAASHVAGMVFDDVTGAVEGVHRGILSRVRATMALASPELAATVDAVELPTNAVYRIVRATGKAASHVSALAATAVVPSDAASSADSGRGAAVLAGLSAAIGDHLAEEPRARALAPVMSLRRRGAAVALEDAARSCGTRGLAVFLHGLGGTEHQWDPRYEAALADRGFGSLFVRYNTGCAIHENGTEFAALLAGLHARVQSYGGTQRLLLVGHSMGGLLIHSALAQGSGAPWTAAVSDVVTLGSPYRGAPMEKVAAVALGGLRLFRESVALGDLGNRRAIGIKDLRFGAIHPDHWGGRHPDSVWCDTTTDIPLPDHVNHHAVVATLGPPGSVVGEVLGDGLVRAASASGRCRTERVFVHRLHQTRHMSLLRHEHVLGLISDIAEAAGD